MKLLLLKSIRFFLITWFSIFVGAWTLLDPLGGMDFIKASTNNIFFIYANVAICAAFISLFALIVKLFFTMSRETINNNEIHNLIQIDTSRSSIDYMKFIEPAQECIDLYGFSLPTFALEQSTSILCSLLQKNVRVRILLSNPISPSINQRPNGLYRIKTQIRDSIANSLKIFLNLKKHGISADKRKLLQIKLVNILPSIGIIRRDNILLWSPYLSTRTGTTSPFLMQKITKNSFGNIIAEHFDEIWDNYSFEISNNSTTLDNVINNMSSDKHLSTHVDESHYKKLQEILEEINNVS